MWALWGKGETVLKTVFVEVKIYIDLKRPKFFPHEQNILEIEIS